MSVYDREGDLLDRKTIKNFFDASKNKKQKNHQRQGVLKI